MWTYSNPVRIRFGLGALEQMKTLIAGRSYAVVTYPEPPFAALADKLAATAGAPLLVVDDIAPNPDYRLLAAQCDKFAALPVKPEVIVALGGGSVIDSAKVFAIADGDFAKVRRYLESKEGGDALVATPIIAVPTTAGTGSEVTSWATVWDQDNGRKHSLAHSSLYPETALVDPSLMLGKPYGLTLATGLDALSHALESIWNVNANPVSARHAVSAARNLIEYLPKTLLELGNLELRSRIAEASLSAGLAFSNTKTAIAHNLSYPITLGWGVQHGIACSFTLPLVLRSMNGTGGLREASLQEVFGKELLQGSQDLTAFLADLGVSHRFTDHGVPKTAVRGIIDDAFLGERGKNFAGTKEGFLEAACELGAMSQPAA